MERDLHDPVPGQPWLHKMMVRWFDNPMDVVEHNHGYDNENTLKVVERAERPDYHVFPAVCFTLWQADVIAPASATGSSLRWAEALDLSSMDLRDLHGGIGDRRPTITLYHQSVATWEREVRHSIPALARRDTR